jgi:aspartate kinase
MRVLKFGGTSVADSAAIERLAAIVRREREADRAAVPARPGVVVVVSALSGVTDRLLAIADAARRGGRGSALEQLEELHARHVAVAGIIDDPEVRREACAAVDAQFEQLRAAVRALAVLREVTPRSLDAVAASGELLSSRLVAAVLAGRHMPSAWVDPRGLIVTDAQFTAATPLAGDTGARVAERLGGVLEAGQVPVTGGFVASTREGVTTTLGRGGSDYSAALLGAALEADEIQIWTDVDGMLTADPRIFPSPRLVPEMSFGEASELAYFGAKVLHPKTIQPAVARNIPVRILNSRRPEGAGTAISASSPRGRATVAALACKRQVTVVDVTSTRMLEAHGFLRRLFEVFERFQTSVDVVTTSEVSVSVTIDDRRRLDAIAEALSAFAEVNVEGDLALLAVVGDDLRAEPGTFGRVVRALGSAPLRLVSQAASRRNVTVVLPERELADAVARLHEEFFAEPVGALHDGGARTATPASPARG